MFDDIPSDDGNNEEVPSPQETQPITSPESLDMSGFERLWKKISSFGLADIAMRAGTALVTIGLIGLVVWVMRGNFVGEEMVESGSAAASGGASISSEVALPEYTGAGGMDGIAKSANSSTIETDGQVSSRYDFTTYEVVSGDTLFGIAEKYGLDPNSILWTNLNTLYDNPAGLVPGQILNIPPEDGVLYEWHDGDGLNGVASGLSVTPEVIIEWPGNNLSYDTVGNYSTPNIEVGTAIFAPGGSRGYYDYSQTIFARDEVAESNMWGEGKCSPTDSGPIGLGIFIWPANDPTLSGFNWSPETGHYGIDVAGDLNDPIYAVDSGVVVYSGWNDWGYGNVVAIDHGNGFQSLYAHLETINVGCQAYVNQGDIIAQMGSTGNSSGPHLHFELLSGDSRVNPNSYLPY